MIQVDISNIWGAASLPELLALEAAVSVAHRALRENTPEDHSLSGEVLHRIRAAAELIRSDSQVLVVIGRADTTLGIRAALELLRDSRRDPEGEPRIFFAGDSLSTRRWTELMKLLEGKDFSLCVIAQAGDGPVPAIAFRELRWVLERRYGTDEARRRIYAVTDEACPLYAMAKEEDWELFCVPDITVETCGLLPLAVAGADMEALLRGAMAAEEALELRSYENPAWLYAACRMLLGSKGRKTEVLVSQESGFAALGAWWQQLFAGAAGSGIFPAYLQLPAAGALPRGENLFAVMLRFAPPEQQIRIREEVQDLGGVNCLAGRSFAQVEEVVFQEALDACVEADTSVICIDCGALCPETVGELLYFFRLSRDLSERMGKLG